MPERHQPHFIVAVPARNESELIAASIDSIRAAAEELCSPRSVQIVVACDACTDDTARIVAEIGRSDTRVESISGDWFAAGTGRRAAIAHARRGSAIGPTADVWIATTDGDTIVGRDWLTVQAAAWAAGDHAVAGIIELHPDTDPRISSTFERHYAIGAHGHSHVHGANLGVRADAYDAVEGFPQIALAEDHALWNALVDAGFRCRSSVALRVSTSPRLRGRATGGFADTLRDLVGEEVVPA
ncbi:MAG: glycosyl transferase family 2 [Ilumatobacteraceae bacterium]|nr:glycosyl transferase family 2 [Ilumatobacteraceae bacterium]MCU1389229.1 glycosyl transferase family 2 [Ilumatobacteraceae bacterium]